MSVSTTSHEATTATTTEQSRLWPTGVVAGVAAAAATTAIAAIAHASGVSLDVSGEPIPMIAFAQITFMFALVGAAIAAGLRRWNSTPRVTWFRTTAVLTLLSFVPDLLADAATSTKIVLMLTHVVAAAIVIPAVAKRLG